ncbi:ABC transporter permease [Rhodosalinus sp. FB01]|uniref:ABC transporter permease n=1 Tax=Rhodosalinus sp. FB01 TaxID=3239194 RepID=UPI00352484A9
MRHLSNVRLLVLPQLAFLGLFIYGFLAIAWLSIHPEGTFTLEVYRSFATERTYQDILWRTILVSCWTVLFSLLLGYPLAYFLARARNTEMLLLVLISPWLVSIVVRTFGWMLLLGNAGFINRSLIELGLIELPLRMMYNMTGVVIGLVHVLLPLMVVCILSVLAKADRAIEEAAASLGATPVQTFFRVVWPISLPGVYNGVLLVFLVAMGAIVTPILLGGFRETMVGSQIFQEIFMLFDFPRAAAYAIVLLLVSLLLVTPVLLHDRHLRKKRNI